MFRNLISFIAGRSDSFYISRIEKALGYQLKPWQIDYLFDRNDSFPKGRGLGKTTIVLVKACLDYTSSDLRLRSADSRTLRRLAKDDPDVKIMRPIFIYNELRNIYNQLKNAKVKMRNITFIGR